LALLSMTMTGRVGAGPSLLRRAGALVRSTLGGGDVDVEASAFAFACWGLVGDWDLRVGGGARLNVMGRNVSLFEVLYIGG
jgi:hypothetical protein